MTLPAIVTKLLRSSAPTLLAALALPPPFNALASAVASKALEGFAPSNGTAPLKPADVAKTVENNAADPAIVPALRQAEADLKRYEDDNRFRFAELEAKDRENARSFQAATGLSDRILSGGMLIVWIALGAMLVMIVGMLVVVFRGETINPQNANIAVAAFGLIGTAVGFVNGLAATVVAFYWGSSQGSKEKTQSMTSSIERLGAEIGKVAERATTPAPAAQPPAAEAPAPEPEPGPEPTTPATPALILQTLRKIMLQHRLVEGSVTWALTPEGISVEGAVPVGTTGDPTTVTRIWNDFGPLCAAAAKKYGVPVELIVATIATESSGDPKAFRQEKNDASSGLMQTLLATAREALGDDKLTGRDLLDPETSILAGTAYIARQRDKHNFDPVLVAAAYNAGSPRPVTNPGNRWRLMCHPPESGAHIDRFVARFNDAIVVSKANDWSAGGTPSFVTAFIELAGTEPAKPGATGTLTTSAEASRTSAAAAKVLSEVTDSIPVIGIAPKKALAIAVQQKLTEHGYLDPPPDGDFRTVSLWAIDQFCKRHQLVTDTFDVGTARMLLQPKVPLPLPRWTGEWIDRVVDHMGRNGYWFSRFPGCRNIVYLEGANRDGTLNADEPDRFNDLRIVFWFEDDGSIKHEAWEATTEPGDFFTQNPLNPGGAARIKFGQYKAWQVGMHRNQYEALVQAREISVYRDFDKNHKRTGDKVDTGSTFGINQHHGSDADRRSIGKNSAGCLVGRTVSGHEEFMGIVKQDPRYRANNAYKFVTTVLPADEVLRA